MPLGKRRLRCAILCRPAGPPPARDPLRPPVGRPASIVRTDGPELTRRSLSLAACGGKRARKKREVTIHAARVKLVPPGDRADDAPISRLAVSGAGGLDWLLLATEGIPEKDDAVREWYERRRTIKEYFRALKSGMGAEDPPFDDADDLRKCLAFDAACRIFDLQGAGQTQRPPPKSRTMMKSPCFTSSNEAWSRAGCRPKTSMSGPSWSTWDSSPASSPPNADRCPGPSGRATATSRPTCKSTWR